MTLCPLCHTNALHGTAKRCASCRWKATTAKSNAARQRRAKAVRPERTCRECGQPTKRHGNAGRCRPCYEAAEVARKQADYLRRKAAAAAAPKPPRKDAVTTCVDCGEAQDRGARAKRCTACFIEHRRQLQREHNIRERLAAKQADVTSATAARLAELARAARNALAPTVRRCVGLPARGTVALAALGYGVCRHGAESV